MRGNPGRSIEPSIISAAARTILIVDDDEQVTRALASFLTGAGFRVAPFTNAISALRHVSAHPPDAAILDIHLPDLDGLSLSQRLRDHLGPRVPLVMLSGDTSIDTLNRLPHVGATYFFPKPVRPAQLLSSLREWLEVKAHTRVHRGDAKSTEDGE